MPDVKAASLLVTRQLMQDAGPGAKERFEASLTPEEISIFRTALAPLWIPVEKAVPIFVKAAAVLAPADPNQGLRLIGRHTAVDNLNGVYRAIMKVMTIPFVVSRAGRLWQTYHNRGRAWAEEAPGEKTVNFFVADYPELPLGMRELLCGFMEALGQMTQAKGIEVTKEDGDPKRWHWIIRWR